MCSEKQMYYKKAACQSACRPLK